jgi:uncharacterized protein (TIGR03382 family)
MEMISRVLRIQTAAAAVLCLLLGSAPALATPLATNLIVNGNAEANTGAPDFSSSVVPAGWITTSNFSAVQYAAGGGSDLNTADSAAVGGGLNYFAGGPSTALSTAMQSINVADLAASIDAGLLDVQFQAHIGGFADQGDNMTVRAIFRDASDAAILTLTLGPVTPTERGNVSQLLLRSTSADVPVGTREIDILMTGTRTAGSYNDAYADNLALQLILPQQVELSNPGSLALLGLALAGLGFRRRRAK